MDHKYFLRLALEEAKHGRGHCAPNPSVGAIAVKDGKVLATGFHLGPGKTHAEEIVLSQLSPNLDEVVLYVTLEPCNHWGRTPPCVDAIIKRGIKEVVYGFTDPNPIVAVNNTPQILRDNGVKVLQVYLPEINDFYKSYSYSLKNKKPFVTAKLAVSLDGKIAGAQKEKISLSNAASSQFTHEHRLATDWILTTAETIVKDNPKFTARLNGTVIGKKIAILDRQLRVPQNAALLQTAERVLIFYDEKQEILFKIPQCEYIPVKTHNNLLNINDILKIIYDHGAHDIWVEAGGILFTHLHLEGLVQKTYMYLCPKILGQSAFNGYQDNTVFNRQHSVSWRILDDNVVLILDWVDSNNFV